MITVLSVNGEKPDPEETLDQFRTYMQHLGAEIADREWAVEIRITRNHCFLKGFVFRHDPTTFVIDLISTPIEHRRQGAAKALLADVLGVLDTRSLVCGLDAEDLYTATMSFADLIAWYERLGFVRPNKRTTTLRREPRRAIEALR
jgi:ribosomal protein S18 acetylase RimI-like enzyme